MNNSLDNSDDGAELRAVMGDYFAALLRESSESQAPSIVVEAATPVVEQAVAEATPPPLVPDAEHCDPSAQPVNHVESADPVVETLVAAEPAAVPSYQLIRIGGLTLGIPTHAIAEVVTAAAQWAPLSDARAWVLGSYGSSTAMYTVVDTAALLVPGTALPAAAAGSSAVLLAGQRWALACDGVGARITPDPAQVNWRGAQGKRPWLAGTVREPTCALLDIPELLRLLES
jgi:purine-binding chemotaxis protein CheW